ncbi:MAG: hypothetical protein H7A43_12630, partial [Verrucomicrobia bacterium]|nr:hypothetical protein [Verrucomicrobiota bacterium]
VFGLINYQLVIDSGTAASRIAWELDHQFNNQTGGLPAWRQVGEDLGWFGAVFLLVGLCRWFVPGSRDVRAEKIIVLSGWVYFLCLFLIQRQVERYALPVHLIAWWMIGVGLGWSLTLLFRKGNGAGLAGLALICGIISVRAPAWTDAVNAFDGPDTRMQMARYIRDHAWTEGQVMADIYSGIPDCHNPQRSIDGAPVTVPITRILQWEPGFGESMYDTLVAQGYRLVAILPSYRERYANPDLKGGFGQFRDLEQRRDFYRRVMTEGELVHIEYGDGSYLSPTLELYRFGETPPLPPPAQ